MSMAYLPIWCIIFFKKGNIIVLYDKGVVQMNLRAIRKERGLTQKAVAEYLNCSVGVYSRYETGDRQPSIDCLIRLADYFGVSVDYLIGKEDKVYYGLSAYEQSLLTAAKNADGRAQDDALAILLMHRRG